MRKNDDGPKCHDCGTYTERVGSDWSLCPNGYCDRYAIPVNDQGLTEAEQTAQADGISEADQLRRYAERAGC